MASSGEGFDEAIQPVDFTTWSLFFPKKLRLNIIPLLVNIGQGKIVETTKQIMVLYEYIYMCVCVYVCNIYIYISVCVCASVWTYYTFHYIPMMSLLEVAKSI